MTTLAQFDFPLLVAATGAALGMLSAFGVEIMRATVQERC